VTCEVGNVVEADQGIANVVEAGVNVEARAKMRAAGELK